jgi:TolB-like protein
MTGNTVVFGPFVFDRDRLTVTRDGKPISIGVRGSALLAALLDAGGELVGKDALIEAAWPGTIVEESNLTVQIAILRKALGTRPDGQEWIVTVPRVGYRLPLGTGPITKAGEDKTALPSGRPSIAVLPFANLSDDPEQEYLADGVVEDVITALSRFRTFAVAARNSSFVYKSRAADVRDVSRQLGVRYVLEGSVRRSNKRVRVTAQLVDGASGADLWAEKFDGEIDDVFDFQDEITRSVVGLIEPQIRRAEIERARRKQPDNFDAWDLYIQALPIVYSSNVPAYSEAITLLERAIMHDPGYVPALALAAWAHEKRQTFGGTAPPGVDDVEMSMALAERAVAADDEDAFALALLGWLRILFREDFSGLQLCMRAVALNPNNLLALNFAGTANLYAGDLDEVIACYTRALELSPGAPDNYVCLSGIASGHFFARRFEEALVWAQRSLDLDKAYVYSRLFLAGSYAHLGRTAEARAALAGAMAVKPGMTIASESGRSMRDPERMAIWVEGMQLAGMPES